MYKTQSHFLVFNFWDKKRCVSQIPPSNKKHWWCAYIFRDQNPWWHKLSTAPDYPCRQMYQNFTSQFDWYMKADDDTYVIMENLHHMLRQFNPEKPFYIGERSMAHLQHGYNSGGAGQNTALRQIQGCGGRYEYNDSGTDPGAL